jgi:trigger factor
LNVLGEPEGADELATLDLEPGKAVTFSVEVEVAPEFELPDFGGIKVKKPAVEVSDDMVNEQIERLSVNEGSLEPQEKAALGDYCIGHGVMKDAKGEVLLDLPGAVVQVPPKEKNGRGAILGIMVDDFGKQIGLPKAGDAVTVKAKGPENHEKPDVRGKDVVITYTVERVERIVPASVEQLVQRYGLADEKGLRESLMLRLNQRAMIEQQSAMRQQVAKHLLDTIEVPLPEKLTAKQGERTLARRRMELLYRGVDQRDVEEQMAELRAASATTAQRELKLFFILAKAADKLGIRVTEEEVNGRIAQMAMERGVRPDQLRSELMRGNQVGMVIQQVREHKAMDAILSKAEISDISAADYNKMVEKTEGLGRVSAPAKG